MLVALHQLPRSGWPVDRAGLGAKATYPPKRCSPPHNAVGVGLFLLVSLYGNVRR